MDSASPRVTQRRIAAELGVTTATVSLALRGHPSISAATRDRVRDTAARLGYRPDPQLSKLMAYLRDGRPRGEEGRIAVLDLFPRFEGRPTAGFRRLLRGVEEAAARLGYGVDDFRYARFGSHPDRLAQVLEARGIEGILFPGSPRWRMDFAFPFERFSSVAIGYSVPVALNRACAHQYADTLLALAELRKLGYRRPALVQSLDTDRRVLHHFRAAFLVAQAELAPADRIPPAVFPEVTRPALREFVREHRPDVVLSQSPPVPILRRWLEEAGFRVPDDLGLASLDLLPDLGGDASGIAQNIAEVGRVAVGMLAGALRAHERGRPVHPHVVMVPGRWVEGTTTRRVG